MQSTELNLESNGEGTDQTALLRSFAEHSPVAIAMFDRTMHYLMASRRWCQDYGFGDRDINGLSHYELSPALPQHWKDIHQRCLAGAIERSNEEAVTDADGNTIWLKWEVRPWYDATGAIGGIIIFAELITEQKQQALALQQVNTKLEASIKVRNAELEQTVEQLQQEIWERHAALRDREQAEAERDRFFTLAADMFGIAGFDGYFKRINPAFGQVLGYDPDELLTEPFIHFVHPDDREATIAEATKLSQGAKTIAFENRYRCKDGSYRWLSWTCTPYQEESLIYATARDITEHKRAEKALRESKQLLQLVFDLLPQRVFWKDRNFRYLGCNKLFAQDAQLESPEQLIGKDDFELAWKESAHLYRVDDTAVIQNNLSRINYEESQIREDGTMIWIRSSKTPLCDEAGAIVGVFGTYEDITDRKEAEAALQKEQVFLKTILDNLADGIVACDDAGRLTLFNRATREFHGLPEAPLPPDLWAPYFNLYEADGKTPMQTQDIPLFRAFAGEIVSNVEMVIAPTYGHTRVLLASGQAFFDHDGNKLGAVVAMHDITAQREREHAEAQLQEQEQFLRSIYDGVSCSIFVVDVLENGKYQYASHNHAEAKLMGRLSVEVEGKTPVDLFGTTEGAVICQFLDRCVATKTALTTEENLTFDGKNTWLMTTFNPLIDQKGNIHRIVGTSFNINNLKQAEAQLQEQEQFLRSIYDGVNCSIFVIDRLEDGEYQYASHNHVSEKLMGRLSAEVEGKTPADLFGDAEGAVVCQFLDRCLTTKTALTTEETLTFDGKPTWVMTTFNPLVNQEGRVQRIVGTSFNINDLKHAEAQLKQQAVDLEHALQELQRTQTQMVQNEKMSSLGQLVAGVAHEINNPVNFIYGNLLHANEYTQDLLSLLALYQQHYPDPASAIRDEIEAIDLEFLMADLPKLLVSMKVGADRIQKIVASLRSFSRLDEAEVKDVDIHEGIDSTLMILHNRLKSKSEYPAIQIVRDYGALPKIECYAGQLNQVFMNILSNAIDALDEQNQQRSLTEVAEHPSTITIQTSVTNNGTVAIQITDNGPGIPEAVQKRLFDPFFTTKAVGKGTGMGMSISHQVITERHKGCLNCLSSPGNGAAFVIEIPVRQTP